MASAVLTLQPRANQQNLHRIRLRVIIDRKTRFYKTNFKTPKSEWLGDRVSNMVPNHTLINLKLSEIKSRAEKIIIQAEMDDQPLTMTEFDKFFKRTGDNRTNPDFYTFFEDEIQIQKKTMTGESVEVYRRMRNRLKEFAPNLSIRDIDDKFIRRFQGYLVDRGLRMSTVYKHLSILRTYTNLAQKRNILSYNPFSDIKIKKPPTSRNHLTEEELRKVATLQINNPGLSRARDMFVFACCTGIAFNDMINLTWNNIKNGALQYVRKKTVFEIHNQEKVGKIITVPLTGYAIEVLERQDKTRISVFQKISLQKYNDHLYNLSSRMDMDKHLTSHVARHTCGTILINNQMQIEAIAEILGHTSTKTTKIYAKITSTTVSQEYLKIAKKVFSGRNKMLPQNVKSKKVNK